MVHCVNALKISPLLIIAIWENDIPRTQTDCDAKLWTSETIWKANISTGDYHNNMNTENFMNWAVNRFLPTFKQLYPDKVMILIIDNAPYHRFAVGALGSKTKKQLVDLAVEHKVDYIELPLADNRLCLLDMDDIPQNIYRA
jgi:hypothetical protein